MEQIHILARTLIANFPNGVVLVFDRNLRYNFVGGSAAVAGFYSKDFLEGKTIYEALPPETLHLLEPLYLATLDGIESVRELPFVDRFYNVRFVPLKDDEQNVFGGLVIAQDITDNRCVKLEMQHLAEREQELNRLRADLISTVSHEFRTPLTVLLSSTELLQTYGDSWDEKKRQRYLSQIQGAINSMTTLLDDVLLVEEAQSGKNKFTPTQLDLVLFCASLVQEAQIRAGDKVQINFNCSVADIDCYMDADLIRQIVHNLLSNAVKYSVFNAVCSFDLMCNATDVIFQVKDKGIGIPVSDQQYIFEPFRRGSNVGVTPGTGMGLAIVDKAVKLHRGNVNFVSQVGSGTTFTVVLPRFSVA